MAKTTLFDLKEKMATLSAQIAADAEYIAEKAADPTVSMEDINAKKIHRDELQTRFELLKTQHDEMEKAQKAQLAQDHPNTGNPDKDALIKAKAAFYKTALTGGDVNAVRKAYEGLGAIPASTADLGYGENLLPTNMTTELITEPMATNSLRNIEQVSQITGLEEPKLLFTIEDADLADVTDQQTAKEIAMTGDTVSYGRFKTKIVATVKDTVLHGTPTALVSTIENALRSGLAMKEKMRAFNANADGTHDHMSFYLKPGIVAVPGDNLIDAIIKAIGDLPDAFRENATVVMRRADYNAAIATLANGNATLWGRKPEEVIGYPVVFNDKAVVPVVGDFRYARLNYDIGAIYETDKDAKKGEYYFVLTAWGDHQIKLASAFRTAYTRVLLIGATIEGETAIPVSGEDLSVAELLFNDGGDGSIGSLAYLWQVLVGTTWTDLTVAYTGYNTDTLTTTGADDGKSFRVKVSYSDSDGAPSVVYSDAITMTAD
jgi:HK97 family phage major capsid protein